MSSRPVSAGLATALLTLLLSACASTPNERPAAEPAVSAPATATAIAVAASDTPTAAATPRAPGMPPEEDEPDVDPFESFNRKMYSFNSAIDRAVLKPLAKAYDKVFPDFVQRGVANFFRNLLEPTVVVNDILQGKFKQSAADTGRFLINTTVGVAGLFDVATRVGLPRHQEDFGQTLAVWGAESGPYVVLPFLGPRTVRDSFGLTLDWYTDPITYIDPSETRYGVRALAVIDTRSQLLNASRVLEQATDDEYLFVREAYLQRRNSLIHDGNVPRIGQ